MTHPSPKRNMIPKAVLMRSGLVSLTTARPVNTAQPRSIVNSARPMTNVFNKAHSTVRRPINNKTSTKNSNFNQGVNTVKDKNVNTARPKAVVNTAKPKAVLNAVKGNQVNAVKASACWVWKPKTKVLDHGNPQMDLQDQGVIDSGCSRHMTGNMSYLTDFKEIDRGYVAFGGNPKGGKITCRGPNYQGFCEGATGLKVYRFDAFMIMKDVTHGDDDYIIIIAAGVNVLKGFFVIKVTRYELGFGINNVKMLKAACGYVSYLVLLVWDLILLESQSYGNNRFSCLWNLCDLLIYSGDDYLECVDHGSSIGYGWDISLKDNLFILYNGIEDLSKSRQRCDVENPFEMVVWLENSSLNRSGAIILGWVGLVDVRTYLLGGAIDGSEANGIIRDPKLELESSRFTFDLVPLSYESVDVVVGENWLLRHKAEMVCHEKVVKMPCVPKELVGFTPRRRIGFRMELVQGATPICEGSCRLTSLERQEVWNDCRSCKVRVGSNGNLLWEASVLLGRKKGGVRVAREDDRGVTEGREDVREVFQQRGSGAKRKLSRCGRNQMGNEPILALPEGADDFVVYYDARSKDLEACLEKGEGRRSEAKNEFEIDVRRSDLGLRKGCWWHKIRCPKQRTRQHKMYSIHPGADTMLCGFRLTNRWLSMKKDIASCGSKYLAYSEVEVEYQGSSGLLLQPELPE
ncbi:hypothetical protein Tco_0226500 [Tanacetum coccineum]